MVFEGSNIASALVVRDKGLASKRKINSEIYLLLVELEEKSYVETFNYLPILRIEW